MARPLLFIASVTSLYGVTFGFARHLRLFLRQDSGESLLPAIWRNLGLMELALPALIASGIGVVLALGLAILASRLRAPKGEVADMLPSVRWASLTLLAPCLLVLFATLSLLFSPSFPYGSGLAVSLALEGPFLTLLTWLLLLGALAQTCVQLLQPAPVRWSFLLRRRWHRRGMAVVAVVGLTAVFCWLTPGRFYSDGVGQGNMFKYLRMAAALSHAGSLDIAKAEGAEAASLSRFLVLVPDIAAHYGRESARLFAAAGSALAKGDFYTGKLEAVRANRSMFRSAGGGVYYINAPGPGLILVPAYLLDRALNRTFGFELQLSAIVFWNLLAALLVYEIYQSTKEMVGPAAASLNALAMAFSVPILFYTFQIYPELPGGLLLLFSFRKLLLDPLPSDKGILLGASALAFLPWLHQKYSVVAAVLGVLAAFRVWQTLERPVGGIPLRRFRLLLLVLPLAISAYSIFLYNHALTGSLSPTATFRAAGRSSFEPQNLIRGILGLLFDRDNGLFVFAPIYLLALAGATSFFLRHRRNAGPWALILVAYLLTIGSFPYWPGAVSTMARYILSILPLLGLTMAFVTRRALRDGFVAGLALFLLAASWSYSVSFHRDLVPSYHADMLWQRALFSDPQQYLPNLLSAGLLGSGPAHFAKLGMEFLAVALTVALLRRRMRAPERERDLESRSFALQASLGALWIGTGAIVLASALERWPGNASEGGKPAYREARELTGGRRLWVEGKHGFEAGGAWVAGASASDFLLLTRQRQSKLRIQIRNGPIANRVRLSEQGRSPTELELKAGGPQPYDLTLENPLRYGGPRGERYLYRFTIRSLGSFVPSQQGLGEDDRSLGVFVLVP